MGVCLSSLQRLSRKSETCNPIHDSVAYGCIMKQACPVKCRCNRYMLPNFLGVSHGCLWWGSLQLAWFVSSLVSLLFVRVFVLVNSLTRSLIRSFIRLLTSECPGARDCGLGCHCAEPQTATNDPLLLSSFFSGLAAAVSDGGLSSLQRLLVSKCPGVGDFCLRRMLDSCAALEELWAGGCQKVRHVSRCMEACVSRGMKSSSLAGHEPVLNCNYFFGRNYLEIRSVGCHDLWWLLEEFAALEEPRWAGANRYHFSRCMEWVSLMDIMLLRWK